jgi:hypothetical protein
VPIHSFDLSCSTAPGPTVPIAQHPPARAVVVCPGRTRSETDSRHEGAGDQRASRVVSALKRGRQMSDGVAVLLWTCHGGTAAAPAGGEIAERVGWLAGWQWRLPLPPWLRQPRLRSLVVLLMSELPGCSIWSMVEHAEKGPCECLKAADRRRQ